MLSKKRIIGYIEERFGRIRQFHTDFSIARQQADLHQFRVEIKKLRTVTRLLDHCLEGKQASTELQPLRALFKEAGDIRSIHIEIGILEKYSSGVSGLARQKQKSLDMLSERFIRKAGLHDEVFDKVETEIRDLVQDLEEDEVIEYIEKLLVKSAKNLQNPEEKEKIHKARSLMKIVLYTTVLVNRNIREELGIDTGYINSLQEVIGHWHDADIALEALGSHSSITKKILNSMEDEANELSRQVFLMTRDFEERIYNLA
jgi:CHAD domain-containing protein